MVPENNFLEEQRKLASTVKQVDERSWDAASPSHALAWLRWNFYWAATVAGWTLSRTAAISDGSFDAVGESIAFTSRFGHHPALNDAGFPALFNGGDHLNVGLAFVEELAARTTRNGRCFDPRVLRLLRKDNPALFGWLGEAKVDFPLCY